MVPIDDAELAKFRAITSLTPRPLRLQCCRSTGLNCGGSGISRSGEHPSAPQLRADQGLRASPAPRTGANALRCQTCRYFDDGLSHGDICQADPWNQNLGELAGPSAARSHCAERQRNGLWLRISPSAASGSGPTSANAIAVSQHTSSVSTLSFVNSSAPGGDDCRQKAYLSEGP